MIIDSLETHFLGNRAKHVNDEIWEELSYEFVKKKLSSENAPITHEAVLGQSFGANNGFI